MLKTVRTHRSALSLPVLALLVAAGPSLAAPDWDIVGIRLGMSVEQARSALRAHAPKAKLTDETRQFSYNDGVRDQHTPSFLGSITAIQEGPPGSNFETLEVMFSAPPMEQRVIRVIRTLTMYSDPLPLERAVTSVTQKYGTTPNVRQTHNGNGRVSRWVEAGKTVCGDNRPNSSDAMQAPPVDNSPSGLSQYEAWQRRKLAPADASACSAALVVILTPLSFQQPLIREMKLVMTDPGYAIPAMQATAKQIADLQARARRDRQNSGPVPKL